MPRPHSSQAVLRASTTWASTFCRTPPSRRLRLLRRRHRRWASQSDPRLPRGGLRTSPSQTSH
eukprot:4302988-Prymnesium_polylepis.1